MKQALAVNVVGNGDDATQLIDAQAEIDMLRSSLDLPPSPARTQRMHLAVAHSPYSATAHAGCHTLVGEEDDGGDGNDPGQVPRVRGSNSGGVFVANAQLAAALNGRDDALDRDAKPALFVPEPEPEPELEVLAEQMLDLSGSVLDIDGDESPVLTYAASIRTHTRARQ